MGESWQGANKDGYDQRELPKAKQIVGAIKKILPKISKINRNKPGLGGNSTLEDLVGEHDKEHKKPCGFETCINQYNCNHLEPEDSLGKSSKSGGGTLGVGPSSKDNYSHINY